MVVGESTKKKFEWITGGLAMVTWSDNSVAFVCQKTVLDTKLSSRKKTVTFHDSGNAEMMLSLACEARKVAFLSLE